MQTINNLKTNLVDETKILTLKDVGGALNNSANIKFSTSFLFLFKGMVVILCSVIFNYT